MDATDIFRPLLWLVRGLWWLAWDFTVQTVGWSIGWVVWRVLTLGRFPREGLGSLGAASSWVGGCVELTGLAILFAVLWLLTQHLAA